MYNNFLNIAICMKNWSFAQLGLRIAFCKKILRLDLSFLLCLRYDCWIWNSENGIFYGFITDITIDTIHCILSIYVVFMEKKDQKFQFLINILAYNTTRKFIPRNFFTREFSSKEFFFQGMSFQGIFFPTLSEEQKSNGEIRWNTMKYARPILL